MRHCMVLSSDVLFLRQIIENMMKILHFYYRAYGCPLVGIIASPFKK
jgi:hypothetical protein